MHGAKAIEDYRSYEECGDACDVVISRNEHDDDAPLTYRKVLRKFERWSLVMELHIGGRVIGTTAEHPYFVRGKGWTATHDLQPGDEVRLMAPGWKTIENVIATDRLEKVYNLEIEEDHTYFVGCDEWGFSVWAHNAGCTVDEVQTAVRQAGGTIKEGQAKHLAGRLNRGTEQGFTEAVEAMQRYGLNPTEANLLALRIKHGDQAAIRFQVAQVEAFLNDVAANTGIPREQLVGRSLNRSGTDAAQVRAGEGIRHGVDTAGTTPTQHVQGTQHARNPWISTSRTAEGTHFFGTAGFTEPLAPIVAIDLGRVGHPILDVSTARLAQARLDTPFAQRAAARHQELLIYHHVPPQAIVGRMGL